MAIHIQTKILLAILAIICASWLVVLFTQTPQAEGGAFTGTAANPKTSTTTVVGPQGASVVKTQIFAANPQCKSRVITTQGGSAILISFDDITDNGNVGSTTVSGSIGHWQAASTTVAYDSELYGCGTWNAYGYSSTTLTLLETQ